MKPKTTPLATAITTAASATGGSPIRLLPLVPAAASALFALQSHADAAIIYSGLQNITLAHNAAAGSVEKGLDINGDGVVDFNLSINRATATGTVVLVGTGGRGKFLQQGSLTLQKLAKGAIISNGAGAFGSVALIASVFQGVHNRGLWASGEIGYAGFVLGNGDLGWIRLEWTTTDGTSEPNTLTAIDWAYDNVPGESIAAGQTSSVPEPGATALLALAGAAFLRRRREMTVPIQLQGGL